MELADKVVVITGGASGIGRALGRRFSSEGAAAVVLADIDERGAAAAAAEINAAGDDRVSAMRCDVSDAVNVVSTIDRVEAEFGPIDLYCANAGVGVGADLGTPDELWDDAFDVNVRAHIVAARRLVPAWVARGHGYFLSTASAAGLLSLIGAAPYTVTKHAAVAFAEWLAITYGDDGVRVSCLCPMGVRTPLLERGLAAGGESSAGLRLTNSAAPLLTPDVVASAVLEGVASGRFLILPHPEVSDFIRARAVDHETWLAGMRRLQAEARARSSGHSAVLSA